MAERNPGPAGRQSLRDGQGVLYAAEDAGSPGDLIRERHIKGQPGGLSFLILILRGYRRIVWPAPGWHWSWRDKPRLPREFFPCVSARPPPGKQPAAADPHRLPARARAGTGLR